MEEKNVQEFEEFLKNSTLLSDDDLDPVSGGTPAEIGHICFLLQCGEEEAFKQLYNDFRITSYTSNSSNVGNSYFDEKGNRIEHKDVLLTIARVKCPGLVPYIEKNL